MEIVNFHIEYSKGVEYLIYKDRRSDPQICCQGMVFSLHMSKECAIALHCKIPVCAITLAKTDGFIIIEKYQPSVYEVALALNEIPAMIRERIYAKDLRNILPWVLSQSK